MNGDRLIEVVLWVLSVVLAIVFFYNGMSKMAGVPAQVAQFEALGIPKGFLQIIGFLECIGGVMLTVPRHVLYGGTLLSLIMVSSAVLHLMHSNWLPTYRAIVITLMLATICYLRFKRRALNNANNQ